MLALTKLRHRMSQRLPAPPAPLAVAVPAAPAVVDFQQALGRDEITGLPNRPRFTHLLARQAELAHQLETQLSVLVIDWPGYRSGAGPMAMRKHLLTAMAARLQTTLHRKHDVIGSLGDGRLAVLLPFTDGPGADRVARNLTRAANDLLHGAAPPPPAPHGIAGPAKAFGRGTLDEETGVAPDDVILPVLTSATTIEKIAIGLASYCGKGPADSEKLLQGAEHAASVAIHHGEDRIERCAAAPGA